MTDIQRPTSSTPPAISLEDAEEKLIEVHVRLSTMPPKEEHHIEVSEVLKVLAELTGITLEILRYIRHQG